MLPNGIDLRALLVDLYAEQEGVKVTYRKRGCEECSARTTR